MPIEKDENGRPVERKGRSAEIGVSNRTLASSSGGSSNDSGDKTQVVGQGGGAAPRGQDAFDDKTRLAGIGGDVGSGPSDHSGTLTPSDRGSVGARQSSAAPKTELVGAQGVSDDVKADAIASDDPVVGWLVIISGPGRGFSVPIGTGMNSVGRGSDQRVTLSFGDNKISSSKHFFVSYDPRSRQFGLHRGDGANLTYLNDAPVYGSEKLENYSIVEVGATKLRFVAFCDESFSWNE